MGGRGLTDDGETRPGEIFLYRDASRRVIIMAVNRYHRRASVGAAAAALCLATTGVGLIVLGGLGRVPMASDLAMNAVVAVAFPVVGAVIAGHRPGHLLAWVYSGTGLGAAVTLFTYGYASHALEVAPGTLPAGVTVGWVSSWVWTTGVVPLVTFGLLLFPDGALPSRRWRPVVAAAAGAVVLLATSMALAPGPLANHPVADNPLGVTGADPVLNVVGGVGFGLFAVACLASAASMVVRWRRARAQERRQLRWLLYAAAVLLAGFLLDTALPSPATSILAVVGVAFLPVAVGIAIVRERLYDINVLISRSLVYGALTVGVVVTYVVVVTAVGGLLGRRGGLVGPLVATAVVAVAFHPAREFLQRRAARLVYGAQADPYASLARLARRLEATLDPHAVLPAVVDTVADTLRLPYVAIELAEDEGFRLAAAHGTPTEGETVLLLTHQGQAIGRMVLGQRRNGETLTGRERRLLEDLARQAGIAVHAVRLTAALQRSREQLVIAREEERRRLHRDLHDGLGPSLAAMTLQVDVLRQQIPTDAQSPRALADQLKAELQATIPEVRRLIDGLRPPALDEIGLVAALRQQALALNASAAAGHGATVAVIAEGTLPTLTAATEVAAYRIATEAITNAVRHAGARRCTVRVTGNGTVQIDVEDDGRGIPENPSAGVGLDSMRERAAELGGHCTIERNAEGGTTVHARLPVSPPCR